MRRLPPLTALRAFEAAARHPSFKAAADELALTPSAVSHQIRLIEGILGRSLFRRRPRPLMLTNAGAALYPVIRNGFDAFADAVAALRDGMDQHRLRVTATNAFAGRWLVPRLPLWRAAHPDIPLEVNGTDAVVDLTRGDADVAIRYAFTAPVGFVSTELLRDRFWPVVNPKLLSGGKPIRHPSDLDRLPFVHAWWPESNSHAPTWARWVAMARHIDPDVPKNLSANGLSFTEELHAIEAVIAGQGVGLFSDVLVERELANGALVKVLDLALPGLGFYLVHTPKHPRQRLIDEFAAWISSAR